MHGNREYLDVAGTHWEMVLALEERNRDRKEARATYLITWVCYGTWLPGQNGAVSRIQNQFGAPMSEPDAGRQRQARERMTQEPYRLHAECPMAVFERCPSQEAADFQTEPRP